MAITEKAKQYHERLFPGRDPAFLDTDPEFVEQFSNFAFDEVVTSDDLEDRTRMIAILATLVGCQGIDEFTRVLPGALNLGVTPIEAKEIVYQATAYLGMGRVSPFLSATNEVLAQRGVQTLLPGQSTTTRDSRLDAGIQTLVDIVGDRMKDFWKSGPEETRHVRRWVTDNCFGDYYTRNGLDNNEREMITFCFLAAQGGCEPQLTSHARANMRIGNGRSFLIKIVSQCLPYIGYPRSLNALRCVDEASEGTEQTGRSE
jgi:4-carboxymuconolactone decarboxylase